jgi:hypothetical protein
MATLIGKVVAMISLIQSLDVFGNCIAMHKISASNGNGVDMPFLTGSDPAGSILNKSPQPEESHGPP